MNELLLKDWITQQLRVNNALVVCAEKLAHDVAKNNKRIKNLNRRSMVCSILTAASGYLLACVVNEQGLKINKLSKEIEELKNQKGD